jgi:hypothetical protein
LQSIAVHTEPRHWDCLSPAQCPPSCQLGHSEVSVQDVEQCIAPSTDRHRNGALQSESDSQGLPKVSGRVLLSSSAHEQQKTAVMRRAVDMTATRIHSICGTSRSEANRNSFFYHGAWPADDTGLRPFFGHALRRRETGQKVPVTPGKIDRDGPGHGSQMVCRRWITGLTFCSWARHPLAGVVLPHGGRNADFSCPHCGFVSAIQGCLSTLCPRLP